MISFFRNFRRELAGTNKYKKYLLYAAGEVFLIVLGILIALAINNWNQNRIIKQKERFYLEGLKNEFQLSKIKLQNLMEVNRLNYRESQKIADYIRGNQEINDERDLSKMLFNSFSYEIAYNPNNSLLNELINSGRLEDISNPELRMYLTNWESMIQSIHQQEASLRSQRERMIDIFRSDSGSIRTILDHANITKEQLQLSETSGNASNLELVKSREFENNLLIFILTGRTMESAHYQPLHKKIDTILNLIDQELENA